jgi:hypothetical protein
MGRAARILSGILSIATLVGCAKTYTAPDFGTYYKTHQMVSILPFKVTYDPSKIPKNITEEMLQKIQHDEAIELQQQLFIHFLERKAKKNDYSVDFQDVSQTNILLAQSGLLIDSLDKYTKKQIRDALFTDGLISGHIRRSKPMSAGAAIVLGVLLGIWGSTNEVNVTVNIHDGESGKLLWNYEHQASGSVGSSSESLAKNLVSDISKKFPYKKDWKEKQ